MKSSKEAIDMISATTSSLSLENVSAALVLAVFFPPLTAFIF